MTVYLGYFWMIFMANFSRPPAKVPRHSPGRILVFICLLSGTIVWMAYRASLTSKLSVRKQKWPFDSLESLITSGYKYEFFGLATLGLPTLGFTAYHVLYIFRLNAPPRGNSLAEAFAQAAPGTIYNQVYKQNMDFSSFMKKRIGLKMLGEKSKQAYYMLIQNALAFKEFECQVK